MPAKRKYTKRPASKGRIVKIPRTLPVVRGPQGHAFFDAHRVTTPITEDHSTKKSVPITANVRVDLATGTNNSFLFGVFWSSTSARLFTVDMNSRAVSFYKLGKYSDSNTQPVQVRPQRVSLRARNIGQNNEINGTFRYVNLPNPIEMNFVNDSAEPPILLQTDFDKLVNIVDSHPESKTLTGANMLTTKTFNLLPCHRQTYRNWSDWLPYGNGQAPHIDRIQKDINGMSMTCLIGKVHGATSQSYEFNVHSQDMVQFHPDSMMASTHYAPFGIDSNMLNKHIMLASTTLKEKLGENWQNQVMGMMMQDPKLTGQAIQNRFSFVNKRQKTRR